MNADLCYYFLKLKTIIQNMLRWILRKIYATSSVTILDSGRCISVYWRYIVMYLILLFKSLMVERMFKWCCDNIDIKSDTVQVVRNIDYVDRYIIYENKDGKNAIQNVIKYINDNQEEVRHISLSKNLIIKCELIDGTTLHKDCINLKNIFSKYITTNIDSHTIGNVLRYNLPDNYDITHQDNSYILIRMIKDKQIVSNRYCVKDLMDRKILELYNDTINVTC